MSRRGRHGRHAHAAPAPRPRPQGPAFERPATAAEAPAPRPNERAMRVDPPRPDDPASPSPNLAQPHAEPPVAEPEAPRPAAAASWVPAPAAPILASTNGFEPPASSAANGASAATLLTPAPGGGGDGYRPTCTVAQLRRFIKSRPWIPLHELRRRFGIYGGDDDVSPMRVGDHTLFIGLPPAESRLIAELLTGGDVGYELSLDPGAPIVVGVYPMRPVPRG